MTEHEMHSLRENIRKKYETYHSQKPGKYPKIKFNSYPTAYIHLQESIKEELAKYGRTDTQQAVATIPSTKIFAKIFHENYVLKDEKIIDTCYLYATGRTRDTSYAVAVDFASTDTTRTATLTNNWFSNWTTTGKLTLAGVVMLASGFAVYKAATQPSTLTPSGLVIDSPINDSIVPRQLLATGRVTNANLVWVVVHSPKSVRYWVQPEAKVNNDGIWKGHIYVGSEDKGDIGMRAQLRAFVNPAKPLTEGEVLYSWPQAQLSSGIVEVIRGKE